MKALKNRSHGKVPLALLVGAFLVTTAACEEPASEPTTTTATASASEATDLSTYCNTICERASRCGLELAKREAGDQDAKLVEEMREGLEGETERCITECGSATLDDAKRFQLERAQVCLDRTSCDELSACMAAL
ncbi:MAG TPA: hypothetical protein ENK57_17420 [Polyangiaceae bacterium]|nr:hypothetical protein [Polyangiaceae bacterium]